MTKFFKQTIKDVPLDNQTVLVRADYNVPLNDSGKISDDLRIKASLPTLKYLLNRGCRVVIMSHLGRPEGRDSKLSLELVATRLAELLDQKVEFCSQVYGDQVSQAVKQLPKSSVLMLENIRFYPEEEANDSDFAAKIAASTKARYFVQDGFGVVHRAHASTSAITWHIPGVAGLLLEREYQTITAAVSKPERPLVAVLGGAKVGDKIAVIERFVEVADKILIGGAMANTFLNYRGFKTGSSKLETNQTETLDKIYRAAKTKLGRDNVDDFIILPTDVAVASSIDKAAKRTVKPVEFIKQDDIILDIGDQTIEVFAAEAAKAKTIIWNGTLGLAELPEFAHGSARMALSMATNESVMSIIGGGDTADFALKWDGHGGESFSHVSTGGGAGLELMSGEKLPGVEALLDARPGGRVN